MNSSDVSGLLGAIQRLALASTLTEVQHVVRAAVRELAACDGATFVLRDRDRCYYVDEDAISPLWKGMRFPLETCISGWAMLNRDHAIIPDIYVDDRIPHDAYRPTFVRSLVMMPIRTLAPIGALGAYWAEEHEATDAEVGVLRALAEATALALEKVSVQEELHREVEMAVEAHRLAQTDELTGLLNRRGFLGAVSDDFQPGAVAFLDINGLKRVNDTEGHEAGDRLIQDVVRTMLSVVRPGDVAGRLGGDELVVYAPGADAASLCERLALVMGERASVGTAPVSEAAGLPDALLEADAAMYEAKTAARLNRV